MNYTAVIGLGSSGSSALALAMAEMGVHMGTDLTGSWGGEDRALGAICDWIMPFPGVTKRHKFHERTRVIRQYLEAHCENARILGQVAGGKYPGLCVLGRELRAVCGDGLRLVHIYRPLRDSIASLQRRCRMDGMASDEEVERYQKRLWAAKYALFARHSPAWTVDHRELMRWPADTLQRLADELRLPVTSEQLDAAVSVIDLSLSSLVAT